MIQQQRLLLKNEVCFGSWHENCYWEGSEWRFGGVMEIGWGSLLGGSGGGGEEIWGGGSPGGFWWGVRSNFLATGGDSPPIPPVRKTLI